MRKGNYIDGGDGNIQIYNENGVVNLKACPEYKSLEKAAEQELEKLRKIHQEAIRIINSAKFFQYIIYGIVIALFTIIPAIDSVSSHIPFLSPIAQNFFPEVVLMALGGILILGLMRMEIEKDYSRFLRKNYYRLDAIDKALTELYALTCQKFSDTPLIENIRRGMDVLAALKQDYETFVRKESKKLKLTF